MPNEEDQMRDKGIGLLRTHVVGDRLVRFYDRPFIFYVNMAPRDRWVIGTCVGMSHDKVGTTLHSVAANTYFEGQAMKYFEGPGVDVDLHVTPRMGELQPAPIPGKLLWLDE